MWSVYGTLVHGHIFSHLFFFVFERGGVRTHTVVVVCPQVCHEGKWRKERRKDKTIEEEVLESERGEVVMEESVI